MELLDIDATRVIQLTQVRRPTGALYLPDAVVKLAQRYSFIKTPTIQDLTETRDSIVFKVGKFNDTHIAEFSVYHDGFIVEARSNSKILDAFLDDLIAWGAAELGLEAVAHIPVERHHESQIMVRSSKDLTKVLTALTPVAEEINKALADENFKARPFSPTGFLIGADGALPGSRRKESRFLIDRRIGTEFGENIYYSQGPLTTDAHLAVLDRLERLA